MAYVMNPYSYKLGYSLSWSDDWYSNKKLYPVILQLMLTIRYFLLFFWSRKNIEHLDTYLSHVNLTLNSGRLLINLFFYEADMNRYQRRRYKMIKAAMWTIPYSYGRKHLIEKTVRDQGMNQRYRKRTPHKALFAKWRCSWETIQSQRFFLFFCFLGLDPINFLLEFYIRYNKQRLTTRFKKRIDLFASKKRNKYRKFYIHEKQLSILEYIYNYLNNKVFFFWLFDKDKNLRMVRLLRTLFFYGGQASFRGHIPEMFTASIDKNLSLIANNIKKKIKKNTKSYKINKVFIKLKNFFFNFKLVLLFSLLNLNLNKIMKYYKKFIYKYNYISFIGFIVKKIINFDMLKYTKKTMNNFFTLNFRLRDRTNRRLINWWNFMHKRRKKKIKRVLIFRKKKFKLLRKYTSFSYSYKYLIDQIGSTKLDVVGHYPILKYGVPQFKKIAKYYRFDRNLKGVPLKSFRRFHFYRLAYNFFGFFHWKFDIHKVQTGFSLARNSSRLFLFGNKFKKLLQVYLNKKLKKTKNYLDIQLKKIKSQKILRDKKIIDHVFFFKKKKFLIARKLKFWETSLKKATSILYSYKREAYWIIFENFWDYRKMYWKHLDIIKPIFYKLDSQWVYSKDEIKNLRYYEYIVKLEKTMWKPFNFTKKIYAIYLLTLMKFKFYLKLYQNYFKTFNLTNNYKKGLLKKNNLLFTKKKKDIILWKWKFWSKYKNKQDIEQIKGLNYVWKYNERFNTFDYFYTNAGLFSSIEKNNVFIKDWYSKKLKKIKKYDQFNAFYNVNLNMYKKKKKVQIKNYIKKSSYNNYNINFIFYNRVWDTKNNIFFNKISNKIFYYFLNLVKENIDYKNFYKNFYKKLQLKFHKNLKNNKNKNYILNYFFKNKNKLKYIKNNYKFFKLKENIKKFCHFFNNLKKKKNKKAIALNLLNYFLKSSLKKNLYKVEKPEDSREAIDNYINKSKKKWRASYLPSLEPDNVNWIFLIQSARNKVKDIKFKWANFKIFLRKKENINWKKLYYFLDSHVFCNFDLKSLKTKIKKQLYNKEMTNLLISKFEYLAKKKLQLKKDHKKQKKPSYGIDYWKYFSHSEYFTSQAFVKKSWQIRTMLKYFSTLYHVRFSYARLFFGLWFLSLRRESNMEPKIRYKDKPYKTENYYEFGSLFFTYNIKKPIYDLFTNLLNNIITYWLGTFFDFKYIIITNDDLSAQFMAKHIARALHYGLSWREVVKPIRKDLKNMMKRLRVYEKRSRNKSFMYMNNFDLDKTKKIFDYSSVYIYLYFYQIWVNLNIWVKLETILWHIAERTGDRVIARVFRKKFRNFLLTFTIFANSIIKLKLYLFFLWKKNNNFFHKFIHMNLFFIKFIKFLNNCKNSKNPFFFKKLSLYINSIVNFESNIFNLKNKFRNGIAQKKIKKNLGVNIIRALDKETNQLNMKNINVYFEQKNKFNILKKKKKNYLLNFKKFNIYYILLKIKNMSYNNLYLEKKNRLIFILNLNYLKLLKILKLKKIKNLKNFLKILLKKEKSKKKRKLKKLKFKNFLNFYELKFFNNNKFLKQNKNFFFNISNYCYYNIFHFISFFNINFIYTLKNEIKFNNLFLKLKGLINKFFISYLKAKFYRKNNKLHKLKKLYIYNFFLKKEKNNKLKSIKQLRFKLKGTWAESLKNVLAFREKFLKSKIFKRFMFRRRLKKITKLEVQVSKVWLQYCKTPVFIFFNRTDELIFLMEWTTLYIDYKYKYKYLNEKKYKVQSYYYFYYYLLIKVLNLYIDKFSIFLQIFLKLNRIIHNSKFFIKDFAFFNLKKIINILIVYFSNDFIITKFYMYFLFLNKNLLYAFKLLWKTWIQYYFFKGSYRKVFFLKPKGWLYRFFFSLKVYRNKIFFKNIKIFFSLFIKYFYNYIYINIKSNLFFFNKYIKIYKIIKIFNKFYNFYFFLRKLKYFNFLTIKNFILYPINQNFKILIYMLFIKNFNHFIIKNFKIFNYKEYINQIRQFYDKYLLITMQNINRYYFFDFNIKVLLDYKKKNINLIKAEKKKNDLSLYSAIKKKKTYVDYFYKPRFLLGYKLRFAGRFTRRRKRVIMWLRKGLNPIASHERWIDYGEYELANTYSKYSIRIWLHKNKDVKHKHHFTF